MAGSASHQLFRLPFLVPSWVLLSTHPFLSPDSKISTLVLHFFNSSLNFHSSTRYTVSPIELLFIVLRISPSRLRSAFQSRTQYFSTLALSACLQASRPQDECQWFQPLPFLGFNYISTGSARQAARVWFREHQQKYLGVPPLPFFPLSLAISLIGSVSQY